MYFDNDMQYPSQEVPNINFVVNPITLEPHYVQNQNVDSSIGIDDLQYEDISVSSTRFELQPAMATPHLLDNSISDPLLQSNAEIWNDLQQSFNFTTDLSTDVDFPQYSEISSYATSNIQYPAVTTSTNQSFNNMPSHTTTSETLPVLSITKQPKKLYRFRFEREIRTESHGFLLGTDSAGRNLMTFPTVELQVPHSTDERYFIRCTLHQPLINGPEQSSFISPHILCRRESENVFSSENKLFRMERCNDNYQFKLKNFLIMRPIQKKLKLNCEEKYEMLLKQNGSKLCLMMPSDQDKMELQQVQIGFEVFKLMPDESYIHVAGPIFSHCVTNGESLKITRICNLHGDINGNTEVTMLITGYNTKMNISIEIDDTQNWHRTIDVEKAMLHSTSAITFTTPRYDNERNQNASRIKCEIQLKCEKINVVSNIQHFTYTKTLKRSFDESYHPSNEAECKVKKPEPLSTPEPSFIFGNMNQYQTDSVAVDGGFKSSDAKVNSQIVMREPTNSPIIAEATSSELDKTLKNICDLYKAAENVDDDKKLEYSKRVRQNFEYYEQESPCRNSILHDIFEDDKYQRYEMKLYKIIQHFELENLIRDSKNIYGETPLMYACMFNRPQLVRALIRMGCPIQAEDCEDGNNALHLISQEQSDVECRKNVMTALKASNSIGVINSFIRAMKNHNLNGLTPLHVAVMYDNVALVTEFLRFCKKYDALDVIACGKLADGNTILHQAVLNRSASMYSSILKYIPDDEILNLQNYEGNTAAEINQNMEEPLFNRLVDSMSAIKLTETKTKK